RTRRRAAASSLGPIAKLSSLPASLHRTRRSHPDRRTSLCESLLGALADRQRQGERRARVRARADVDRPAVSLGDRARDEETEAGAGLRSAGDVRAAELLEDEPLLVVRDAGPVVGDGDPNLAVLLSCAHLDLVA